ncbi:hypothetical protein EWM64_g1933 [Hericium alpestre]|uniref:PB1 domain-containing protein n=1 Tax=Hericium alpestre TaxID=135208 RepID=A0A4Z0A727_9AGAM|nr:hypothetical protein EWM64_g1933 [Hericium alpestre]
MSAVHFKLSKLDGLTRRVSFSQRPSWDVLAAKIQLLYGLPVEHIAVSYIDTDGDEVTLSSEEELQDFYATTPLDSPIKFIVLDLGSIRASLDEDKPLPATPPQAASARNTFGSGVPLVFEVEDDWQRLGLSPMYTSSPNGRDFDNPHAFVEVVETEADSASQTDDKGSQSSSDYGQVLGEDKGKIPMRDLRAKVSDDVSSSTSIIDDDLPNKLPVHVQIHGLRGVHSDTFGPPLPSPSPPPEAHVPVRPVSSVSDDTNTARLSSPFFAPGPDSKTPPGTIPDHAEDDPPLPEIAPGRTPAASLTNDVASLLNSLSSAFTAHPELSDGLRHLVRNATNGTYWATHRESVSRAAEGIRRAAQEVQDAAVASAKDARVVAEEEAGRRVTEAIGNILQAFTQATGVPAGRSPGTGPSENAQGNNVPAAGQSNAQAPVPPPPIITSNWNQWARAAPPSSAVPPGAVPPPGVVQPSPAYNYPQPATFPPGAYAPPPGAVPPPGYIPAWSHFNPYPQPQSTADAPISSIPPSEPAEVSYYGASPRSRPRASELRASLEAAKQKYKAEKERYRQEREIRRKLKEQQKNSSGDSTTAGAADVFGPLPAASEKSGEPSAQPYPASPHVQRPTTPPAQIISNARGSFPQFELRSLPHSPRSPRKPNAASASRRDRGPETPDRGQEETMRHLVGRLGDMGFTESSYPLLRKMVSARLPQDRKRISRAEEDNLVSDVVDELLTPPVKESPPKASGSGLRVQDLD